MSDISSGSAEAASAVEPNPSQIAVGPDGAAPGWPEVAVAPGPAVVGTPPGTSLAVLLGDGEVGVGEGSGVPVRHEASSRALRARP